MEVSLTMIEPLWYMVLCWLDNAEFIRHCLARGQASKTNFCYQGHWFSGADGVLTGPIGAVVILIWGLAVFIILGSHGTDVLMVLWSICYCRFIVKVMQEVVSLTSLVVENSPRPNYNRSYEESIGEEGMHLRCHGYGVGDVFHFFDWYLLLNFMTFKSDVPNFVVCNLLKVDPLNCMRVNVGFLSCEVIYIPSK